MRLIWRSLRCETACMGQQTPSVSPVPPWTVSSFYISDLQLQRPPRSQDTMAMASPSPVHRQLRLPPVTSSGPRQSEEGKCPALAQGR